MRIVFMGTPEYAVPSLKKLAESKDEIVGVFTQPDKVRGRGNKVSPSPAKEAALALGIPVFQPARIRSDGLEDLRNLKPDLCVTAAFGQILSQEVLDIPPLGTVNVHASLLPRYRGSSPIPWCLMAGETVTGVTTMFTDAGIDTGDILLMRECPILPDDNTATLTEKLALIGSELLIETIGKIKNGNCPRIRQDESRMSYFPKITKEMGVLDFSQPAETLRNRVRALNPWPGCVTCIDGIQIKVWEAAVIESDDHLPIGTIIAPDAGGCISVAAADKLLRLTLIQAPGGKRMRSCDYLKGHRITAHTAEKPF